MSKKKGDGNRSKYTEEMFLEEVAKVQPDITVLGKYTSTSDYIEVRCNKCGKVWTTQAGQLMYGHGCAHCAAVKRQESKKITLEKFCKLFNEREDAHEYCIHEDTFVDISTPVTMTHECGLTYEADPCSLIYKGVRCPSCSRKNWGKKYWAKDERIIRWFTSQDKWAVMFRKEYQLVEFVSRDNIKIRHKRCGTVFTRTWEQIHSLDWLCPVEKCKYGTYHKTRFTPSLYASGCQSYAEMEIKGLLEENGISFKMHHWFADCRNIETNYVLYYDFAIFDKDNQLLCLLEYDGKQHFEPIEQWGGQKALEDIQYWDEFKNQYCLDHNIKLYRISYLDEDNIEQKLKEYKIIED